MLLARPPECGSDDDNARRLAPAHLPVRRVRVDVERAKVGEIYLNVCEKKGCGAVSCTSDSCQWLFGKGTQRRILVERVIPKDGSRGTNGGAHGMNAPRPWTLEGPRASVFGRDQPALMALVIAGTKSFFRETSLPRSITLSCRPAPPISPPNASA